jgi:hypothetical protein
MRRWRGRELWPGAALAAAIALPFLVWDFGRAWEDLVVFHLTIPPRPDSMTIAALWQRLAGAPLPRAVFVGAWVVSSAWIFSRQRRRVSDGVAAAAVASLWFFLFAQQAFFNYWYFAGFCLLLATGCAWAEGEATPGD